MAAPRLDFASLNHKDLNAWLEARNLPRIEDEEMDGAALLGVPQTALMEYLKWSLPKFGKLWTLLEEERENKKGEL